MGKLDGKIALITGSGSGIGRATALVFAAEGAKVAVVDRAGDNARAVAAEIAKGGGEAVAIVADVSKGADTERMVAETVGRFGRLDILYNNAGIGFARRTHLLTEEEWDRTIDVDLKGVFLGCKYALPELMKRGGAILSTASVAGIEGFRQMAAVLRGEGRRDHADQVVSDGLRGAWDSRSTASVPDRSKRRSTRVASTT